MLVLQQCFGSPTFILLQQLHMRTTGGLLDAVSPHIAVVLLYSVVDLQIGY